MKLGKIGEGHCKSLHEIQQKSEEYCKKETVTADF